MPQHITLRDGLPKVRDALENGLLGAEEYNECLYEYPCRTMRCAIGWMLNNDTLQRVFDADALFVDLETLLTCNLVTIDPDDVEALTLLQILHDYWASQDTLLPTQVESLSKMGFSISDTRVITKQIFADYVEFLEKRQQS